MSQTKAQLIDNLVQPITGALGSASAPTFSFTSNPNTGLYSPGTDQLALSTGGSGRLFIDSSGKLLVGADSDWGGGKAQVANGSINIGTFIGAVGGAYELIFEKSRSSTVGTDTIVLDNDNLGQITFKGGDNSQQVTAAAITSAVNGTPGANRVPGELIFSTATDASPSVLTARMRITSNGTFQLFNSPGIDFSQIQTNAAGVTSETLDSYEEGTWTPSFALATSGSVTYSLQVGEYVKIGNTVTVRGGIGLSAVSAPTGSVTIAGLPFTSANRPNNVSSATIGIARAFTSAGLPLAIYNNANFNILLISKNATNTNFVALQGSDLAATTVLYFTITYGV